jgi:hypothetical protein
MGEQERKQKKRNKLETSLEIYKQTDRLVHGLPIHMTCICAWLVRAIEGCGGWRKVGLSRVWGRCVCVCPSLGVITLGFGAEWGYSCGRLFEHRTHVGGQTDGRKDAHHVLALRSIDV